MSEEMRLEWEAWRSFCVEFGKLPPTVRGIDAIDDRRARLLLNSIRLWGERLAALRRTQDVSIVTKAMTMALEGKP